MDKKIFTIEINGIKESVEAVTSLNKQLDDLEKRINELNSKKVIVQTTVNTSSSTSNASALNEEAAIEKEILALKNEGTKLEAKQVAYQDESYQKVLAQKDVLKEIVEDQKTIAAQERLQADTYSNTMQGMKAKLADLKTSIASTDLGDSDKLNSMTAEANELTNKLKEMEEAYGQFGRNVGNYQSAAEGFKGLEFTVGGVTQQFDNAKQALKTLQGELRNLQVKKDQGMILSDDEIQRFQELPSVVAKLKSSIQDAGKPMDNLMDTMQSFVAIAQVSKGASAFFGIDADKIEESIQKLVALQNVMQGMQALQKQIQSQEFLGGWLSKGNEAIDNLVAKLTSANAAQQTLTTTTNAGATASKAMATAEGAQAVATKATTVATKGLSLALKSIGIGLIISAVAALITYWDDIKKLFTDTVPALKNLSTWFNKVKAVVVGVGTSIINYFVQPIATAGKLIAAVIEGNFKDIPKIITDGFKKTFNVVGNFQKGYNKEIQRQQDAHNEEMRKKQLKANEEAEKDAEAKYGKDAKRTKKYLNDQLKLVKKGSEEEKELKRKLWQTEREEKEKNNKKNLADSKKYAKEEAETEKEYTKLKIENMKDGLLKTITQLEEERKERLSKLNTNARNYGEMVLMINQIYDKKIEDAKKEHGKNLETIQKDVEMNLINQRLDYANKVIENIKTNNELFSKNQEELGKRLTESGVELLGALDLSKPIEKTYEKRKKIFKDYWDDVIHNTTASANAVKEVELGTLNDQETKELRELKNKKDERLKVLSGATKAELDLIEADRKENKKLKKKQQQDDYLFDLEVLEANRNFKEQEKKLNDLFEKEKTEVQEKYYKKREKITQDTAKRIQQINAEAVQNDLQELRDYQTALKDEEENAEVKNAFGFTNWNVTGPNYKDLLSKYTNLYDDLGVEIEKLSEKYKKGEIDFNQYQAALREYGTALQNAGGKIQEFTEKLDFGSKIQTFMQEAQQYIQAFANVMGNVLEAMWTAEDAEFEREQENLEKQLDAVEEYYDKMDEAAKDHADNMKSIESDIASAQGDARDRLIQRYNAEKQAQREALKEKKKAEKEQEKLRKQQDKLDLEQREKEKKRDLIQAAINTAMAITAAAVNKWPEVALPMMAAAAAAGAAQIAAIQAQQYANGGQLDGGVAVGNRHSNGGIKVLGGRAEIEGGEFITNRQTTMNNVELLEFINSRKKRVNLDDMVEFYGGKTSKVASNVLGATNRKYADGGTLPIISSYSNNDALAAALERYANRPSYVAVTDIIDKTADVNNVRVMAGLGE